MKIGDIVRRKRLQNGWTQKQLADVVNMKQSTISRIESNGGLPTVDKLDPLAKALGISVDRLFENEHPMHRNIVADSSHVENRKDGTETVLLDRLLDLLKKSGESEGAIGPCRAINQLYLPAHYWQSCVVGFPFKSDDE